MRRKKSDFARALATLLLLNLPVPAASAATQADALLATIRAVGREGSGNSEAGKAWKELVRLGPAALPAILAAFDGADATVANWLRPAVDAIAERALAAKQSLPTAELERFIAQERHSGVARRLAYEWLTRVDPQARGRLLPGMLHDSSLELRRDAVELVLANAKECLSRGDKAGATKAYRHAFTGARDRDQVERSAKELQALGVEVDVAAHFGFLRQWRLLGPFDSSAGKGFEQVFPPEKHVDLAVPYAGKNAKPLRWITTATTDPYGTVDLNKALGKHMGAAAYAFAAVLSPTERPVEIRAGSQNALKIFLNGQAIFAREEYHHGMQLDQHSAAGTLRAGRNEILIKICQNEQPDDWAQNWSFQVRICDSAGGSVPWTLCEDKP